MAAHGDMAGMTTMMHNMNLTGTTMDMGGMGGGGDGGMGAHEMPMPSNDTCGGGMKMFFHTGKCEYILFETLRTTNVGEMVGACIVIFVLAMAYEGLKVLREYLLQRALVNKYSVSNAGQSSTSQDAIIVQNKHSGSISLGVFSHSGTENGCHQPKDKVPPKNRQNTDGIWVHMMSLGHLIQTLLHVIQVFMSYCLMLIFMSYNAWLCIAVLVGAGVGYFLFGWKKAIVVDMNEHCH